MAYKKYVVSLISWTKKGMAAGAYGLTWLAILMSVFQVFLISPPGSWAVTGSTTLTVIPIAPSGLTAADKPADDGKAINLSWTPSTSTSVTEQRIYRATTTGGPYSLANTILNNTTTTYTDTGLTNGTTYYYVVRAFGGGQESGNSNEANAVPVDNIPPNAPTVLSAVDVPGDNGGAIVLNWTPSISTDVTQQRIYSGTTLGGPYPTLVTTIANNTTATYTNSGLTNGTTYYYIVRAYDGTQESVNSNESSAVPIDNPPNPPTLVSAADVAGDNGGAIVLNWTLSASTDATQQRIYRGTTLGGPYPTLVTTILNNTTVTYTNSGLTNGTTYYYIIRTFDGTQESGNSNETSAAPVDNIAPNAPTLVSAADVAGDNGGAIVLNWTVSASTDVTQQRIYRGTTLGGPYPTLVTTIANNTTATYTDTGLTNGTTYYYVVRAYDGTQESVNSNESSAAPVDNIAPNAPTVVSAADVAGDNGGAIVLNWTVSASADVTQQRIYRGTTLGGPYPTLVTTILNNTTNTYTNTGLTNGTTYYYVVRAYDGTQESVNSNESSAAPVDNIAPNAPAGVSAADVAGDNGGAIVVNWTPSVSTDVTQQRVYRSTTTGGPYSLVTTFTNNTTNTYTNSGLTNGTIYYYIIRTFDGTQESGNSNESSAAPVDNIAPNAPTLVSAADVAGDNGGAIVVNWTPSVSTDVTQQRVYRSTTTGGPYSLVTTFTNNTTNTFTNSGLTNGTTYYYIVRAYDGTQESVNSNESSAVPIDNPPNPPTLVSAADVAGDNGGAIVLNWTLSASTDATQQRIYRGTTLGGPYPTLVTTILNNTTNTYTNSGLTNGTTYYYIIRTFDGTQESGNSNEANATPLDNIAPNAPTLVSAADVAGDNGGAIVVNWMPSVSTDVTQQRIYRGTTLGGPYPILVTTILNNTTVTYTNSGLTNGTTYYYIVRAYDGTQESGNSNETSAAPVDNIAPNAPTLVSAADVAADSGGAIVLNWTPSTSTDVTQQRVYRSTITGGPYSLATTITNNTTGTYTDTGLTNGLTYYFVIRAYDGTNESVNSNEANAVPIGPPSATNSAITATTPVYADGISISTVTITVRDGANTPISGATVALSSSRGTADTITQPAGTTSISGQITGTVKSATAGVPIISAVVNGTVNLSNTATITFYNTVTGSNVTVSPTTTSQVTFTTVTGVGITSSQSNATGTSLPAGYANPSYYDVSTTAGYTGTVKVCITYNPSLYLGNENRIVLLHNESGLFVNRTFGPVDTVNKIVCGTVSSFSEFSTAMTVATKLVITSTPQIMTAGQASNVVTIEARDSNNVLDTSYGGVVTLSSGSASMKFDTAQGGPFNGSITQITFTGGTGTFYFKDTLKGTPIITVSATGLTSGQQTETIQAGAVNASMTTVIASPSSITADGISTATITVTPRDLYGNTLGTGQTVTISRISGTGTLLSTVVDNGDGTYTRSVQSPTLVGSGTFQGVVNSVTISQTAVVTYAPGPVHHYIVTTTSPETAGKGWTETVRAEDIYNNFASNDTSTILLAGTGSLRFYSGSSYTTEITSTTLSGGLVTLYLKDIVAETTSFTVTRQGGTETGASGNITVNAAPVITTSSLPQGTLSISYSRTLTGTGGTTPLSWSILSGSLPTGLSLNSSTSLISGTPSLAGNYPFTIQLTDANMASDTKPLSIIINAPPTVSIPSLPDGTVGASYTSTLTATGGTLPLLWSIVTGTIPVGLTLDSATGVISGTPTTTGTSSFTVRVTDANSATNDKILSIMIYSALSITTAALPDGALGTAYNQTLAVTGGKTPYSWSISTGSLPSGLALNGSTGVISGTPASTGTSSFTVRVQDSNGAFATKNLSIAVYSALTITTSALSDGTVNQAYSQTLAATGGKTPYAWSLASGTLPAGLLLDSGTGVISGMPTTIGTSNFTLQVTDANSQIASKALSINIYSGVAITTVALPEGTIGAAYSATLAAAGGKTPYTWSITVGTLPPGLSLNTSTGVISGSPTTAGTYPVTVQVTDNNLVTNTKNLSITIYSAVTIVTVSLSDGTINAAYSQTLTASGGKTPYQWSIASGTLPAGLALNGNTGVISGTPSSASTSNFTVQVLDANGALATNPLSIMIYSAVTVTTLSLSDGTVSLSYSQTLTASGGKTTYTWNIISGTLPSGLSLNSSTGALSGAPTAGGASAFTVQVTDANGGTDSKALSITIYATLTITTATLPDGTVGAGYSTTLNATGGKNPLVWGLSSGAMPAGLSLNSGTGVISGAPVTAGTSNFTLQATDANGATATKAYTVVISPTLSITTTTLSDGTVNASYSQTLAVTRGKSPYSWSVTVGALPAGLTLASGTGVISGIPTVAGTSNFTVQVTDANGATATQVLGITIYSGLSISTASLSDGTVNLAYSQTLTSTGGKAPLTWSITTGLLPTGLTLNASTGVINGTPSASGTFNFTLQVVDVNSAAATKALSIVIYSALSVTTTTLSDGTVGVAYSQTVSATGGKTPYSWSVTTGSLPTGLSLNSGTGVISGSPTVSGTSNFTVRATDANGATAEQALSIAVYNPLSVTTGALASGTINLAYSQTLAASGGKTPYTWIIISGTLPTGLSLSGATGVISGTPTGTGTWNFTVQVADAGSRSASQALSITIYSGLTITTASLPDGTVTAAYTAILTASGGQSPYTWTITVGSLPVGLTLNSSTGVISGTPTTAGTYLVTMQVTDSNLSTQTKALSITVYGAVSVVTTALSDGTVNAAYSQALNATGGKTPYTWTITVGSLPTGLVLNGVTGVISGTPSVSGSSGFTVQVTDANGAVASQALSVTVYTAISVSTTALTDGTVNLAYSQTLAATGGKSPLTWSVTTGVLPAGLSLAGATGVISGTPTTAGTNNFTVQVVDANGGVATKALSIIIYSGISVTTTTLSDGMVSSSYSQTVSASGGKTPYAWGVTAGSLPAGLSLNSSTGVVSGTPTTVGTSNFTVQVTDANGATATKILAITVYDTLAIATTVLPDGTAGLVYNTMLTATGGKSPLIWSITVGVLPGGLTLDGATGVISGTPTTAGTNNITVRVTDTNGAIKDKALSVTIYGAVSVTTTALSDGTANGGYSQMLVASGGKTPYTWSVTIGTLPAGLSLNSSTGVISSTPTIAGTSNFTVQVADANGATATKALSITIYPAISVTTTALSDGTVNLSYTQTLAATGGKTPYSWSVSVGTLPAGLSLNSSTGAISGTPTAAGTSNFTVQVTDANGAQAAKALSITVYAALSVTTTALADGTMSLAYTQTLASAGGKAPVTWSITVGSLPTGLTLNSATGDISGMPTVAGTFNFTVRATDANGAISTQALSITIYSGLSVTTASLSPATVNTAFSQTLTAAGGKTPYSWAITVGTLPAGLTLNSATGVISGTPTTAGTSNLTVQVMDANSATNTRALSIVVNAYPAVTTAVLADGTVNLGYSQTLTASGGTLPVSWSIAAGIMPAGLSLNGSTGAITGTPTLSGTSNFTVRVTDTNGAYSDKPLSITVYPVLIISTAVLVDGTINLAYGQTLASNGGKTPLVWNIASGNLPAGLSLNGNTGVISGVPTTAGTSNFTVLATDANGATATKALSIIIYSTISVTTTSLPDGTVNLAYNQTLTASGGKTPYTWSVLAGSIPAGVSLNSSTGVISGTPNSSGTYNFTIRVTDANGATADQPLSITNFPPLSITTPSLADGTINLVYSQTITSSGGKSPLVWSIITGTLPVGLALNSGTGVISGIPTTAGTSNFTVQVTDSNGAVNTRALSITIYSALSVSTASLSDGTVNGSYNQTLTASGGKTPYIWSVTMGTLPGGLTLNSGTGVISGTPTLAGTSNFTVQAMDANGATATKALSVTIYPALSITTASLSDGTVNLSYNQSLAASGGKTPYSWSVSLGSLPAGLNINSSTGVLSGTPTASGTSNFTVQVMDANGAVTTKALSITIYAALSVATTALADGTVNLAYSQTLASTGGKSPIIWSVIAGSLPTGLTLNSATGVISGMPTVAGTSNFTIMVTDANGATATQVLSITVYAGLSVITTSLSDGTINLAYNQTLTASGGKTPLSWGVTIGSLPAGLSLNSSTGVVSGTPTTAGTSNFTVQATDANSATASKALSITVYAAISITTAALNNGTVGAAYSQTVAANGGKTPYVWSVSVGSLPPGLVLNTSTGAISGTPTAAGTSNFTIQVQDANGATDAKAFSVIVSSALSVTTSSLSDGTVNLVYNQTLTVSGGNSPYTWTILLGNLPAGLTLNSTSGVISGTPTVSGTSNFTVQVTDVYGAVASKSLNIIIYPALSITTLALSDGTRTAIYNQTLTSSGGKPPVTWSMAAGSLPSGLTLNGGTGVISGTPTTAGPDNFTIQVQDINGAIVTRPMSLQVNDIPMITTASLAVGTAGAVYNQTLSYTGGTAPLSWGVMSGSLPAGLSLNSSTGVISGMPTTSGIYNFTIIFTDSYGVTDSKAYSITILSGLPSGTITLTPLPSTIVADGITISTVTSWTITDSYGNGVPDGTLITIATDRGSITTSDASGAYAGIQAATVNGIISFVIQSGIVAGTANVTAVSVQGSAGGSIQIIFLPGPPSGTITLTPNPASILADGVATSTVTSGVITDTHGNTVLDGSLITVATDRGTITTPDASGAYAGVQVATVNGVVSFVVQSATSVGTANVTAVSVTGSASGSTQVRFLSGPPYGNITLTPNPAIMPADGTSTSTITSGVIKDAYGNIVSDGTLITVSTDKGTITTPDASGVSPGVQVVTSGGIITFTAQAGITEGIATITATSVQGSASGLATITLTNVPPELNYPAETGYGIGDALEPNRGIRSTLYTYKIVYKDINNNPPVFIRICIDSNPCAAMSLDSGAVNPFQRDGNYSNGEQYVYTINTLTPGDHTYYFETSDGLAYTKLPSSGSLNGPHVNYPPELTYSLDPGYGTDGVDPNSGNTTVAFNFKLVYRDIDNQAPASIRVCIDSVCYAMLLDVTSSATLRDGNYTNGEQYVYTTLLPAGTHNYYFDATDGLEGATLPISGNLSGPIVTSTYTPAGSNVVVNPDPNFTITYTQVITTGDTYVTTSQIGSPLPSGYLHGAPPAYFDIWTSATYTGKVKICYTYNDITYFGVGYGGERGLRLLHNEGGAFSDRTVTLDVNNNFVCGEVYSFSEFVAAVEEATLVTLTSFRAAGMDGKVMLTWATASEVDSMGFNILRGTSQNGPFNRINDWVIRSKGTATHGVTYTFEDIDVQNGSTYFYRLENADINGKITAHMIASATPAAFQASEAKPQSPEAIIPVQPGQVSGPSVQITTQEHPGGEPSEGIIAYMGIPAVTGGEPPVVSTGPEVTTPEGKTVTEPDTGKKPPEIMPQAGTVPNERRSASSEPVAAKEKRELPKGFTLKISDDDGNEIAVRLPENSDSIKEPFELIANEDGKITLRWFANGNLKGFNILRLEGGGKEFKRVNTLSIPFFASQGGDNGLIYSFKDAGITKGKLYSYKLETVLSDGAQKLSNSKDISTK